MGNKGPGGDFEDVLDKLVDVFVALAARLRTILFRTEILALEPTSVRNRPDFRASNRHNRRQ